MRGGRERRGETARGGEGEAKRQARGEVWVRVWHLGEEKWTEANFIMTHWNFGHFS